LDFSATDPLFIDLSVTHVAVGKASSLSAVLCLWSHAGGSSDTHHRAGSTETQRRWSAQD